jgi:hypothetical protein
LIVMMAALEAAGFDPTPPGKQISPFRAIVRKDNAALDPALRERMKTFSKRQTTEPRDRCGSGSAVRFTRLRTRTLAHTRSARTFGRFARRCSGGFGFCTAGARVLPQIRNRRAAISYVRAYQAEGDRLRKPAGEMVRSVLSYLHTRPITVTQERVRVQSPDKRRTRKTAITTVAHDRKFFIVPDLLAVPGAINFRVITDDYYAVIPEGTDPTSSELRRAFIQFVVDALVLHNNKEVAARREQIKQLIDARTKEGGTISPDVFVVVTKSLVAAADARYEEAERVRQVDEWQRARVAQAKDEAIRTSIVKQAQGARAAIADEAIARLAEDYDNGAVLDFYFADQLRDVSASGFDLANFLGDMINGFDPTRIFGKRSEVKDAHDRAIAARKAHPRYSSWLSIRPARRQRRRSQLEVSRSLRP